jgi:benzodiazapine receptor
MSLSSLMTFGVFVALVVVVALSGVIFKPGTWYLGLEKPSWTPPNRAFPVVWSVLYVMIAAAGWRVYETAGLVALPFAAYGLQLVLNAAWSWLFFGLRRPNLAFADIVLMTLAIVGNIALFAPIDPLAAWLLVPYLVWAVLAACLNRSVWRRNPGEFGRA